MRHFPTNHRFSQWDGSQKLPLDPDEIMAALADDLIEYGDLRWAMRNLMSKGMQIPDGGYMQGLRDMLKELRERKRQQLERFDLSSIFEDFRERLDEILQMERSRIDEWLNGEQPDDAGGPDAGSPEAETNAADSAGSETTGGDASDFSGDVLKNIAERNRCLLPIPAGSRKRTTVRAKSPIARVF